MNVKVTFIIRKTLYSILPSESISSSIITTQHETISIFHQLTFNEIYVLRHLVIRFSLKF